ncbi:hypothetical protein JZO66_09950 [Enterococcus sp. DIV0242_7C1]|uniref:Glycosyltransferase RgtA/B/C/D-like domain-containing protein n=1 Tax=Candidatus Enterococcus dunnyi TaxID=1834192 RepID=A0A200J7W7_9ENTE|nr:MULTISPECIES: DUF6056 family protein [unclassified Enterococcus]MBO0470869.1 hypothetical protein [Enterococcus sp. DIV0242_7C1]OUZ33316.1 hypothetical protein A5889_002027 [Enterococcus sp. 9D6_DIV0238]
MLVDFIKKNKKNLFFYGGLFLLVFLYLTNFKIDVKTDDGWFMTAPREYDLFSYLQWRYEEWSARLFPETTLYFIFLVPLFVHHFISACAWFLYSYSLVRLFSEKVTRVNFLVAFFSLGFMNVFVMKDALFWITGATNYLWPLSLGLFALIPYADNFFRRKQTTVWPYLLPAFLFSLSNEQLIACVIGVVLIYHVAIFLRKQKENYLLFLPTSFFIGGAIFMLSAPGNDLRLQQEVKMWMPDYHDLSIFTKVLRGSSWLFEGWQTKLLLLFIVLFIVSALIDAKRMLIKVTGVYTAFLLLLVHTFPDRFTNFQAITKIDLLLEIKQGNLFHGSVLGAVAPFVLWGLFFLLVIVCSITVSEQKIFLGLSYCAAVFSSMIMWFSPTMYASGARVFMCASVFLIINLYLLYQQLLKTKGKEAEWKISVYACFLPAINLLFVLFLP